MPAPVVIVATAGVADNQRPPPTVLLRFVVLPWHTVLLPVILVGVGFTVNTNAITQPAAVVYLMLTTPALPPVTTPLAGSTVAKLVLALLHVPPGTALLSVRVAPVHTLLMPVMGAVAFTVTVIIAAQPAVVV
jgi:hypothetical protein